MPLTPTTRLRRHGDVIAAGIAEETILLNPNDRTYVRFNETAARIRETLDRPRSMEAVAESLLAGYAIDRATCEREVAEFVSEMEGRGFIVAEG